MQQRFRRNPAVTLEDYLEIAARKTAALFSEAARIGARFAGAGPALVDAMDAARRVVHLETYIFEFAGSALSVAEALERAAQRGVVVRLVIDGVGTPAIPPAWRDRFDTAGVHWHI